MKSETHESTTAYGLSFLEMIRRTKDKRYADTQLTMLKYLCAVDCLLMDFTAPF